MRKVKLKKEDILFADLSYKITGLCFFVHQKLGRFAKEKQYCNLLEAQLKENNFKFTREFTITGTGNRADFIIEDSVLFEIKAKPFVTREDYYQTQRYLKLLKLKLGIIVNFQDPYIKQQRIINFQN